MLEKILQKRAERLHAYMNKQLPKEVRKIGLQFFLSRFREQGWLDKSFEPWAKRKGKDRRKGRAILIDKGRLRNSIRADIKGHSIIFGTDVPYAKIHNEGGTINRKGGEKVLAFKAYTRGKHKGRTLFHANSERADYAQKAQISDYTIDMPKRQFIGESAHLNKVLKRKIENDIKKILKGN